jgi:hypothetical protein
MFIVMLFDLIRKLKIVANLIIKFLQILQLLSHLAACLLHMFLSCWCLTLNLVLLLKFLLCFIMQKNFT